MTHAVRPLSWLRRLLALCLLVAMLGVQGQAQMHDASAAAPPAGDASGWAAGADGRDTDAPVPDGTRSLLTAAEATDSKEPTGGADLTPDASAWGHARFASEAPASCAGRPLALHAPSAPERPPRA